MPPQRIQLTLFVGEPVAASIEAVRREFNPKQHALIGCHVTLCREGELESLTQVLQNLEHLKHPAFVLEFGPPTRFSEGKGVLLPNIGDDMAFHRLREAILKGAVEKSRKPEAHITLMHPRNSACTDEVFERMLQKQFPKQITFSKISLIEQEAGQKWHVLKEFDLMSC
jgi:hypothetical protein